MQYIYYMVSLELFSQVTPALLHSLVVVVFMQSLSCASVPEHLTPSRNTGVPSGISKPSTVLASEG